MEEQPGEAVPTSELIRYVYQYALYALEDSLDEFKFDVQENQGWSKEEAERGHAMLQRLIASVQAQKHVLEGIEGTPE